MLIKGNIVFSYVQGPYEARRVTSAPVPESATRGLLSLPSSPSPSPRGKNPQARCPSRQSRGITAMWKFFSSLLIIKYNLAQGCKVTMRLICDFSNQCLSVLIRKF